MYIRSKTYNKLTCYTYITKTLPFTSYRGNTCRCITKYYIKAVTRASTLEEKVGFPSYLCTVLSVTRLVLSTNT